MRLDEFESVFRSAIKPRFTYAPLDLGTVLLVSDRRADHVGERPACLLRFRGSLNTTGSFDLVVAAQEDWRDVPGLLSLVEQRRPGLVVTWRNLLEGEQELPWTVGPVVHALTQATDIPLLLAPAPGSSAAGGTLATPTRVLVVTDHLTGDDHLVNWGVHFTAQRGHLHLAHIEERTTFEHYMDVIGRLPSIDTDAARERIHDKLLELPEDYCISIVEALAHHGIDERVVSLVSLGDPLADYQALLEKHRIELLVCNTKDAGQEAMASLAHALAVELRRLPLLLL